MTASSSCRLLFVGDTHGFLDDMAVLRRVIITTAPAYVLAEQLQEVSLRTPAEYAAVRRRKRLSATVSIAEIQPLINLCQERGIALIGIDLQNFGFTPHLLRVVSGDCPPTPADKKALRRLATRRERHQRAMINRYAKRSTLPVVVIIGAWHLRTGSPLLKGLHHSTLIIPVDAAGNLLVEPPMNGTAHFREQVIP